ncbi:tetratricopeptide repeat protein [Nitrogeniibacter aestuarii]|uniref:tetratricopeptide repeat protein n=1 Tax=Nitrogeniibacter aestuarii TaxID=2815343 RepID=UPI001E4A44C3|nr:tetratricopeptide repeat protein [Nitrogeniibacter aestuarii]
MIIKDQNRPYIAAGLIILISLGFAGYRAFKGSPLSPAREEAIAIHEFQNGQGREAAPLFKQLATKDDSTAEYYLGEMYRLGDGVPRSGPEAVKWLTRAAEAGNTEAARQLGLLYLNGDDAVQDLSKARHWFNQAALHQDAIALRHLGTMNAQGLAGPADPILAYADYAAAAYEGDSVAVDLRDRQALSLTAEEQAHAESLARTLTKRDAAPAKAAATSSTHTGTPAHTTAPSGTASHTAQAQR